MSFIFFRDCIKCFVNIHVLYIISGELCVFHVETPADLNIFLVNRQNKVYNAKLHPRNLRERMASHKHCTLISIHGMMPVLCNTE